MIFHSNTFRSLKNGIPWALILGYHLTFAAQYDPGPGKTVLLIGQTFTQEYKDYVSGMGQPPGGSSHYGELYNGSINQGDDAKAVGHLAYVSSSYPKSYAMVAISWKDNPDLSDHGPDACGGFTGHRIYQVNGDIIHGRYDAMIDSFAVAMKTRPDIRFFLRIEYEVSRFLFSWKDQTRCPQSGKPVDFKDSTLIDNRPYRDAFNYIASRLRTIDKVGNVDFVFHPVRGIEDAQDLYPGPEYVDFVALSVFNDDLCISASACKDSLDPNSRLVFQWAKDKLMKPIMIAESAAQRPSTESEMGMKTYLSRLLKVVDEFDVRVLCYINSDWNAHGWNSNWGDSRVESRPGVKEYWKTEVLDNPRFLNYGTAGLAKLPQALPKPAGGIVFPFLFQAIPFRLDGKRVLE